jgi:predicted transcriptional regulator
MRTTIELKPEHRARLREIALRRKLRGVSRVIAEALDAYFDRFERPKELRRDVLRLMGSITAEEARHLRETTQALRARWR